MGWTRLADAMVSSDPAFGLEWRLGFWSASVRIVRDFWVTGVGFGCFEPVVALLCPLPLTGVPPHAHNLGL